MVDQAQQEKEEAEQEAEKARRQMELDVDEEIEQLKSKCASLAMAFLLNSSNLPCIPVSSLLELRNSKQCMLCGFGCGWWHAELKTGCQGAMCVLGGELSCTNGVRRKSMLCHGGCLRCSYEARLAAEQETGLRLRGELGLLKKRVGGFQGQAEELQAQLQRMHDLEASLHKVHAPLTRTFSCTESIKCSTSYD